MKDTKNTLDSLKSSIIFPINLSILIFLAISIAAVTGFVSYNLLSVLPLYSTLDLLPPDNGLPLSGNIPDRFHPIAEWGNRSPCRAPGPTRQYRGTVFAAWPVERHSQWDLPLRRHLFGWKIPTKRIQEQKIDPSTY